MKKEKSLKPSFVYNAEVLNVIDGDTLELKVDLGFGIFKKEKVRLLDIDTPETRTKDLVEKQLGLLAKQFVIEWSLENDGKVILESRKYGKYGRSLVYLYGETTTNYLQDILKEHGFEKGKELSEDFAVRFKEKTKNDTTLFYRV